MPDPTDNSAATTTEPAAAVPEAATPGGEDVAAKIDSLMAEIEAAADEVTKQAEQNSLAEGGAEIDALAAEMGTPETTAAGGIAEPAKVDEAVAPATAAQTKLDAMVAEVDAGPEVRAADTAVAQAPVAPVQTVQSLDAQLAKLTDDMLEGEGAAIPRAARVPAEAPVPQAPAPTEPVQAEKSAETGAVVDTATPTKRGLGIVAGPVRRGVGAVLGVVTVPLAKPMVALPKAVRVAVSVLSAYTAALGFGACAYLVFHKPAEAPAVVAHGFDFEHASVPRAKVAEEHVADAHAADAHGADAHGAPKDAHGGDGHGADTKKKPPAKKPPAKKAAKDPHAKSGGH